MLTVIRKRGRQPGGELASLVRDTQEMVTALVRENRALKARNQRLTRELERASAGWEQIRRLARTAPRKTRG